MYDFVLKIIIMLSLGTIVYLIARVMPRVSDEFIETEIKKKHWFSHQWVERGDAVFNVYLEKFLRRTKILLMKLNNITDGNLSKIRNSNSNNGNNKEKPTLFNGKTQD